MQKLDLRKELKHLYNPSAKKVEVVDVPRFQFLMLDGAIEPGHGPGSSPGFEQAMQAVYGVTYTLKFAAKQRAADPVDYPVMALEGLWWVEGTRFEITNPEGWHYTLLVLQPDFITAEMFAEAREQQRRKKGDTPALARLRLEAFHEGLSIQTLHLGPYATEMETIAKMDAFAQEQGYTLHGKHHEIYLGDPRRSAPEKLRTILRHPVTKAAS